MIDLDDLRSRPDLYKTAAANKGSSVDIDAILTLDKSRREAIQGIETLRAKRNEIAGQMKGGKPDPALIEEGKQVKVQIADKEAALEPINQEFVQLVSEVPNLPSEDTPVGDSEDQNVILKTIGEKPSFDFEPKPHWEMHSYIEQERAVRISGARFAYLQRGAVRLQFAMNTWAMDILSNREVLASIIKEANLDVPDTPFVPMLPPVMMRTEQYQATGRLKPDDVTFKLANDDLWLIGSAEHSLCAYYLGDTLKEEELPIRFVGHSTSFRREVGSAGKDTRGIIRTHHFDKLEMESFGEPSTARSEHEFMIAIQEHLMQQLKLPYQVVLKCTFDMGSPNERGVDIETWMPGQNLYRETHSADLIGQYQARRLQTKVVKADGTKDFVCTNDATAVTTRVLVAIMENYQQADGSIVIPEVLVPYMNGVTVI